MVSKILPTVQRGLQFLIGPETRGKTEAFMCACLRDTTVLELDYASQCMYNKCNDETIQLPAACSMATRCALFANFLNFTLKFTIAFFSVLRADIFILFKGI